MPLLVPGDPEFAGFDVTRTFESRLPPQSIMEGAAVSQFYANLVADDLVFKQWENFSAISRHGLANIAMTKGLSLDRLGALTTMFEEAPRVTMSTVRALIDNETIKEALLAFDDALEIVATKAPVVGWVAQVALFVYDTVRKVIDATKAQPDKSARARAIAYDKDGDQSLVGDLLQQLKEKSWTPIFLPQQHPNDVCITPLAYTQRGAKDGVSWEVCNPGGSGNYGWGLTPGLSSSYTGVVGVFQSPRQVQGSTRDAGWGSITPFGQLVPSAVQFGLAVWQMMLKNGPNAFRIKGERIVREWHDYYGTLFDFAYNGTNDEWLRKQILYSCRWYLPELDASVVDGYEPDELPSKYTDANTFWYSELMAYCVEQLWKPRLSGFLETITCAYVDDQFQALKEDPELRQKHYEMRQLLLHHRAKREVELDLIPDGEYRNAMHAAKMTPEPKFTTAQPTGGPKLKWLDYVPPVDPDLPPTPEPEGDPAPGLSPVDGAGGGGGALLALLALVGAGAVAVARRR